jgi:hypothetical protein
MCEIKNWFRRCCAPRPSRFKNDKRAPRMSLGWKGWARRLSPWRHMPVGCQTRCRGADLLVR